MRGEIGDIGAHRDARRIDAGLGEMRLEALADFRFVHRARMAQQQRGPFDRAQNLRPSLQRAGR